MLIMIPVNNNGADNLYKLIPDDFIAVHSLRLTNIPTPNTVDISISGSGGGGGLGTAINYADGETATPFSYIGNSVKVTENLAINTSNAGGNTSYVVTVIPNVEISSGVAVTVGTGKTMIIDVLKIGDL